MGWLGRSVKFATKYEFAANKTAKVITKKRKGVDRLYFHACPVMTRTSQQPAVVVEDVFSAIAVQQATDWDAFALLGNYASVQLMSKIGYNRPIVFWLDQDMKGKMLKYVSLFSRRGYNVKMVCTEKDPKKYTPAQIQTHLLGVLYHKESGDEEREWKD